MPYIKQKERKDYLGSLHWKVPESSGQLNYVITRLILDYYEQHPRYQSINDVLGALEGAKLEFYRRVAAPYEDRKIKENGDVYV